MNSSTPTRYWRLISAGRVLALAFLAAVITGCGADSIDNPSVVFEAESDYGYDFRLPEDYDPDFEYPLLVVLHGHDQDENQALELWDDGFFYEPDFILVTVRAPFLSEDGYAWFRSDEDDDLDWVTRRRASAPAGDQRILDVIDEFEQQYLVDVDYRIVMGISQGANIAFYTALRHPSVFAGVAAIAGRLDTTLVSRRTLRNAIDLDVFLALGRDEGPRAVEAVAGDERLLLDNGAGVRLFMHDEGHVVNPASIRAMEEFFELTLTDVTDEELMYEEGTEEEYYDPESLDEELYDEY